MSAISKRFTFPTQWAGTLQLWAFTTSIVTAIAGDVTAFAILFGAAVVSRAITESAAS